MQPLITTKLADTDQEINDLLAARWSPRTFSFNELNVQTIMRLFEAARWAPSSNNIQPWRFTYGRKGTDAYDKIFDCLVPFNQGWAINAPLLILTAIKEKMDNGKDNYHALHDLGLAVGNLTVQAQSEGIAVHQMAGVDWDKAKKDFNIPDGYHLVSCIAVGYYGGEVGYLPEDLQGQETAARKRKELSEIVEEGRFPMND